MAFSLERGQRRAAVALELGEKGVSASAGLADDAPAKTPPAIVSASD